jgi:hypothetical protein
MCASYATEDRIFFASVKMSLPSDIAGEEKTTIFCYDSLTQAVSEIMPQNLLDFSQGNLQHFAVSGDSWKILVPGKKNTLFLYAIGPDICRLSSKVIVDTNESLGKDDSPPKLPAQWKGLYTFSCLVSGKSRFLTDDPNTPHRRKEIVILGTDGNLKQVLSKDWPDDLLDY